MKLLSWFKKNESHAVPIKVDGNIQFVSKKIHDAIESLFVKPTTKTPKLNYCYSCGKTLFDDQRFDHDLYLHEVEPASGKLFTETDAFFVETEKDADDRGVMPW